MVKRGSYERRILHQFDQNEDAPERVNYRKHQGHLLQERAESPVRKLRQDYRLAEGDILRKNLYGVVAVVSKGTSMDDAITAGKCALDNPVIMEGLIDSFKQKLKKFASVAALSIAPFLVACAGGGHQPTLDQTAILNTDTIPEMVQAFSQKIREEANNVQNYDVTKTPSGQEAQEIYAALMNGTMKVNVEGDDDAQKAAAQKAATAFARGLDQELRAKQKLPGSENMFHTAAAEPAVQPTEEVN